MKKYFEKNFDEDYLKSVNIQEVGCYIDIGDDGLTEKGMEELSMNDESGFSTISYTNSYDSDYVKDTDFIDENSIYFDKLEYEEFINNLMNTKKYKQYLIITYKNNWDKRNGYKIVDKYEEVFINDYECSQYVLDGSRNGKWLLIQESSHDVPCGAEVLIIGLTNREYNYLEYASFDKVVKFVNSIKKERL